MRQRLCAMTLLIISMATASANAAGLDAARPEKAGMSSDRLDRIAPAVQAYIDQGLIPGAITAVLRRGKLVHFQLHGSMDTGAGKAMRKDAIFRIASMTKPITSAGLMMLWEQGRFQLRDPVAKFLPEFADVKVSTTSDASGQTGALVDLDRPIQIRDMLTHTAGLANSYRGNTAFYAKVMQATDDDDLESYIKRMATLPLNNQPGTTWEYSGATDVVGRLIEVISGEPLDVYLQQRVFEPLGMTDTAFYLDVSKADRLAAQYQPGADLTIELQDPGGEKSRFVAGPRKLFRGAGGLLSTAGDYLRFQQTMLNGGQLDGVRILGPRTVSLMIENHTADMPLWLPGPGMGFGLGYGVVMDRGAAATPLSEGAAYWGGAYCTLSWFDPAEELVGVLMTQVRPYTHLNIRSDFQALVYQAIID